MTNQPAPSDTPSPQINAQAFWMNNCHVVDYEVAFEIEKGLLAHIARLEKERIELHLEIERLESRIADLDKEAGEIEDKRIDGVVTISGLRDTIGSLTVAVALADKELAEAERALAMATDAANKGDEARCKAGAMQDMIDDLRAQLATSERQRKEMEGKLSAIYREDQPWSLREILSKLVEASDILLYRKDYDGHGWEAIQTAHYAAKKVLSDIQSIRSTPETKP